MQDQIQALHSKNLEMKNSNYYFDVREAKNGNQYLTIAQTSVGKDGKSYRSVISVFGNHLQQFAETFSQIAEKVQI